MGPFDARESQGAATAAKFSYSLSTCFTAAARVDRRQTPSVGSVADIVFVSGRPTTAPEVNEAFRQEAASARYDGILGVSEDPLVSADIVGDPRAAIVDLELTTVVDGTLVKVMAWYDNEWGFTHQMIREARSILSPVDAPVDGP
jgi:glyceraldehyde-3-phosphate dehydrogenase/erythrose-4-phosphate dehydrogenase